jgi:hypothetical protein
MIDIDRPTAVTGRPVHRISWREGLRIRKAERRRRQALARELAGYTSPSDLLEIEAVLERHTDAEAAEVRRILDRQRAA